MVNIPASFPRLCSRSSQPGDAGGRRAIGKRGRGSGQPWDSDAERASGTPARCRSPRADLGRPPRRPYTYRMPQVWKTINASIANLQFFGKASLNPSLALAVPSGGG